MECLVYCKKEFVLNVEGNQELWENIMQKSCQLKKLVSSLSNLKPAITIKIIL